MNRRTLAWNSGGVLNGQHTATSKISIGGSEDGAGVMRLSPLNVTGVDSSGDVGTSKIKSLKMFIMPLLNPIHFPPPSKTFITRL